MISYIKGALGAVEDDVIVVETGGIGLAVHVPLSLLEELPALGEEVTVYYVFPGAGRCYDFIWFSSQTGQGNVQAADRGHGIGPKGASWYPFYYAAG